MACLHFPGSGSAGARRTTSLVVGLCLATLLLTACTSGDQEPSEVLTTPGPAYPVLSPEWRGLGRYVQGNDEAVLVRDDSAQRVLDTATGAVLSTVPAQPGCDAALGPDGSLAARSGPKCLTVSYYQRGANTPSWRRGLARTGIDSLASIYLGSDAVTFTGACGLLERFDTRTGEDLPRLLPRLGRGDCTGNNAVSDGEHLAVWVDDTEQLTYYDADTGARIWQRAAPGGHDLSGLLTNSPTVLATGSADTRQLVSYDRRGREITAFGYAWLGSPRLLAQDRDTVVVDYDGTLAAYDARSGAEAWHTRRSNDEDFVGIFGDRAMWTLITAIDGPEGREWQVMLISSSLPDNTDRQVLGTIELNTRYGPRSQVLGGRWLFTDGDETMALPIPSAGVPAPVADSGDLLTSAQALDLCAAVSPDSRRQLGIGSAFPPTPDCSWRGWTDGGGENDLQVHLRIVPPNAEDPEQDLAIGVTDFKQLARKQPMRQVPGFGDEAWFGSSGEADGTRSGATFVGRWRNLVYAVVAKREGYDFLNTATHNPASTAAGVVQAAGEVLAAAGGTAPPVVPTLPGEGVNVCRALAPLAQELVPDSTGVPRNQPGYASCRWESDEDIETSAAPDAFVTVMTVPNAPLGGADGTTWASMIFTETDGRSVAPLGGPTKLDRWNFEQGRHRDSTLTVRVGNRLITASFGRWGRPTDRTSVDRAARELARAAVEIAR